MRGAVADLHHRDDRGNADDDPERREQRPGGIAHQSLERDIDSTAEFHDCTAFPS